MLNYDRMGVDWLAAEVEELTDQLAHITPSQFNEQTRYLPDSVTPMPGFIRYDVNPYMREILDCADPRSDVREVNLKKGVQITYTTLLESVLLYYIAEIKTRPCMMVSADRELVKGRIENYILPMLNQSDMGHLIQSSDEGNQRKTGKTANHLQWLGGGFLVPGGANNADKMRMWSILLMLKDEIDAWPDTVGKDGDPDELTDDRCSAYWVSRKIYRGGTPLIKGSSKIQHQYERGDQRVYNVLCRSCSAPQTLRWSYKDNPSAGFQWQTEAGVLLPESVCYACVECGHKHFEHDKTALFSPDNGAHWQPTAKPAEPGIRSYHLPALYSPYGFAPWSKCVSDYLKGYDPENKRVTDVGKYQVFYNNILGEPFEIKGARIRFESVSAHRRTQYAAGIVPNTFAQTYAGSKVLFITCHVDVHEKNLAVSVMGWTRDARCFVIDYWRFDVEDNEPPCTELDSKVWARLRALIEETAYKSDDDEIYRVMFTTVDAGYSNATVVSFCSDYESGVVPILGRDRPGKNQSIKEFGEFSTTLGTVGYKIVVDHYKDRLAPVLRREWTEDQGDQPAYHFNAPVNMPDAALKELTKEVRRKKVDPNTGVVSYYWHRLGSANNELWDLLVYGNASVEIIAWNICVQQFELETVDWSQFWDYAESDDNAAFFGRLGKN